MTETISYEKIIILKIQDSAMDYDHKRSIEKGDEVIGSQVDPDQWTSQELVSSAKEWIIATEGDVFVRHIAEINDCRLLLTGNNENKEIFPDIEMPLSDISGIYKVVKVGKFR